ncbi:MAG: class I SAM-dependent methyltransferase [Caldilineaceae bacterium]
MNTTNYAERNREAWNQVTPIHQQHRKLNLQAAVQAEDFSVLDEIETAIHRRLGLQGKRVAHLCCNNGQELISLLKLGAASGVGFDIADEVIKEATLLASLSKTNCDFVRTNVYEIDPAYFHQFDLVFTTIGALCWFHDLERFFAVAAQLLRPNGYLFVYEMHPILNLFALPGEADYEAEQELKLAYTYFRREPFVNDQGLDYVGNTQYAAKATYAFPHTLAAIFTAMLKNGLTIREFQEYAHDISADFKHLEKYQMLPMCFTVVAQKEEAST